MDDKEKEELKRLIQVVTRGGVSVTQGVHMFPGPVEAFIQNRTRRPLKYSVRNTEPGSMESLDQWRLRKKLK